MNELRTITIPAWTHNVVQGVEVDTIGLPITPEHLNGSVTVAANKMLAAASATEPLVLRQLSAKHARSFDVSSETQPILGIWSDQFDNRYSSLSTKGNNFTEQAVIRSATAPSGYMPYGLQEGDALRRILKASNLLREHHIPTEWIVHIAEPKSLAWGAEYVSQNEYKRRTIEKTLFEDDIEEATLITQAIRNMTFFVTTRAMEINDRPWDFTTDLSAEAGFARLSKVFTVYNLTHAKDTDFRRLDIDVLEDREYYFGTLFPTLRGRNLARLHNIGLVHRFPVVGNVTALGGIIDLDSVYGEPLGLGDKPIEFEDIAKDFTTSLESSSQRDDYGSVLSQAWEVGLVDTKLGITAEQHFLAAYFAERGLATDSPERLMLNLARVKEYPQSLPGLQLHPYGQAALEQIQSSPDSALLIQQYADIVERKSLELLDSIGETFALNALDEYFNRLSEDERLNFTPEMVDAMFPKLIANVLYTTNRIATDLTYENPPESTELQQLQLLARSLDIPESYVPLLRLTLLSATFIHEAAGNLINALDKLLPSEALKYFGVLENQTYTILDLDGKTFEHDDAIFHRGHQVNSKASLPYEDLLRLVQQDSTIRLVSQNPDVPGAESITADEVTALDVRFVLTDGNALHLSSVILTTSSNPYQIEPCSLDATTTYIAELTAPDAEGKYTMHVIRLRD